MKCYLLSACQLALLSFCCVIFTATESDSTFVPGRCLCPHTQSVVSGPLKNLTVHPRSPSCDNVTVIVTMKNNDQVCLNPEGPMGKGLIRCWKRAHKTGRNVKMCLRRSRGGRGHQQRSQQRGGRQSRKAPSSDSQ